MKKSWIDVSVTVREGMVVWPGDPAVSIRSRKEIATGGSSNVSILSMGAHTGTHMDAPRHFFIGARGIDTIPLDAVIGPARVIQIRDRESIKVEELRRNRIRRGERVLFKTYGADARWRKPEFDPNYVYISADAAQFLADRGVRTVGVDYLSVGGYKKDGAEAHRALLGGGIWIIEGLNLAGVRPGNYDLIALPLRLFECDGSPSRVVLRARK